jgi:cytochrome oxidase Cu insertion factor (SCO1/SenC/PrrC family)
VNRATLAVVIAGLGLVGAATAGVLLSSANDSTVSGPVPGLYRGSEPPGRIPLPRFALSRSDGRGVVRSANLRGRIVLTTFVDSACKDVCPIIVGTLGRALRQLTPKERGKFVALAISVHPKVDTPAHVRRFLSQHGALGQLEYLVAPVARMKPVWKSFHVLSAAETHNANLHSADVRIFDRNGVWVSTMNVGADLSIANVLHDIQQAMKIRAA